MDSLCLIPISTEDANFHACLAQIGPFLVLLDCGWREDMDVYDLAPLTPYLQRIDVVLLSRASIQHLGAYPYLFDKLHSDAVVLCTEPVRYMGELACISLVEELEKYKNVQNLSIESIIKAFSNRRVHCLKYTESYHRHGAETSVKITPYQAGETIGSSFWILEMGSAQMVYSSGFSLRDTRTAGGLPSGYSDWGLNSNAATLSVSPTVFLTSLVPVQTAVPHLGVSRTPATENMQNTVGTSAKVCLTCAEAYFLERTLETLREGGSVLVPVDATGTIFDLLLLLDEAWSSDTSLSEKFPICWVSCLNDIILDQIKTRLEFMSKRVQRLFEERPDKKNPFLLGNVRMYPSIEDMHHHVLPEQPKIVLATFASLENGDSKELLFTMAHDPLNLLWLTQSWYPTGSLGSYIFEDFVVNKVTEKEYEVPHHLKHRWTETQLRAYYDERLAEERKTKIEEFDKTDYVVVDDTVFAHTDGGNISKRSLVSHPRSGETFFEPHGWQAKTFLHADNRKDIDDYGEILSKKEITIWKNANEDEKEDNDMPITRSALLDSTVQQVDAMDNKVWLHDLRIRYGEPMRCEERRKVLRICCRVFYCSLNAHDHRDTRALIAKMRPQHVVALPTTAPCQYDALASTGISLHHLTAPLKFPWRSLKRRAVLTRNFWEKVSFHKLEDGTRVAAVMAVPSGEEMDAECDDVHTSTLFLSLPKLNTVRTSLKQEFPGATLNFIQDANSGRLLDMNSKARLGVESNRVMLEGTVSEEFYRARKTLYECCVAV